jgi:hypothetical protein
MSVTKAKKTRRNFSWQRFKVMSATYCFQGITASDIAGLNGGIKEAAPEVAVISCWQKVGNFGGKASSMDGYAVPYTGDGLDENNTETSGRMVLSDFRLLSNWTAGRVGFKGSLKGTLLMIRPIADSL